MKTVRLAMAIALASSAAISFAATLDSDSDKASYIIGFDMGQKIQQFAGKDINLDNVIDGFKTAYSGKPSAISEDDMNKVMKAFAEKRMKEMKAELEKTAEQNAKAGEAFLAKNKTADGVKETASGLQYKILKEGTGAKPSKNDTVTVKYEGRLLDGTVFDSSAAHGQDATFPLNRVIPGWTEGLQLMKEGSKYTFYIPAKLAYGERGAGEKIGPNATLIFDVELVKVDKAKEEKKEDKPADAKK